MANLSKDKDAKLKGLKSKDYASQLPICNTRLIGKDLVFFYMHFIYKESI